MPDHVKDAGAYLQQTSQTLVSGVRSADAEVAALMSSWRGVAAGNYAAGWDEARRAAIEVLEALGDMAELLGVVAATLPDVDTSTAGRFGSLDLP